MNSFRYLCSAAGEDFRVASRYQRITKARVVSFGLAIHIPVALWVVAGFLLASQLFGATLLTSSLTALLLGGLIYLVERLVLASPPSLAVNMARCLLAFVVSALGATTLDLIVFDREIRAELVAGASAKIEAKFQAQTTHLRDAVSLAKQEWVEAKASAQCEANGTCGSQRADTGPIYRELARAEKARRADYDAARVNLNTFVERRDAYLNAAHEKVLQQAGLLQRVEALKAFLQRSPTALLVYGLLFLLLLALELAVLLVKWAYGKTVDDMAQELAENTFLHRAKSYHAFSTSPEFEALSAVEASRYT